MFDTSDPSCLTRYQKKAFEVAHLDEKVYLISHATHYGRFGQNLSKHSRDVLFDRIRIFFYCNGLKRYQQGTKNYYTTKKANLALQSPHKPFKDQNVL